MEILPKDKAKLRELIVNPKLQIHDYEHEILPCKFDSLLLLDVPRGPATTKLVARRNIITTEFEGFVEVDIDEAGSSANNSTSMQRAPGLLSELVRGSPMNFPFWPGGFDQPSPVSNDEQLESILEGGGELLTIPPGFTRGYEFGKSSESKVDLLQTLETDCDVQKWLNITSKNEPSTTLTQQLAELRISASDDGIEHLDDQVLSTATPVVLNISATSSAPHTEWAEMVDISQPIADFEKLVPSPAMKYPFELDIFQKQAIIKLEQEQYVFVAAHTSAGKTVVAEYAIALSKRHMTRTVYTSPIKALSNQKYRDFKKAFKDVGLITGDLQIEPTATCLIMTTEILRSMLYCGSDITRDLEYVIFDEVHYINDPERGHVWEEIIILLPNHVNIIMLSATVPNTMELANWVGSTKKRKVYVISTLKRPVPLMHYLYTGAGGKSRDDIILLVDEHGKFLQGNYEKAVERKKEMKGKGKNLHGVGGGHITAKQEQNTWIGLIDFLKRHHKMPVVAFTLSRNRCDSNIQALQSVDLNTGAERGAVQKFFQECLQKLKPPDRILPQVLTLKDSLERGIGVHHSGILPILKEIVEMLFQRGLVKLLFATETFAMGVNMPARTVIFDSHKKFDGNEQRDLKPGEYIQMAGRAGRRGHDENGTVILLCKTNVPSGNDLRAMILGQPEKLISQFILRYSVILTCLRIESIKVEDIMKLSFKEFKRKLQMPANSEQLRLAEDKIAKLSDFAEYQKVLCRFHDLATEYIIERRRLMKMVLNQSKISKELKVGRVIFITQDRHWHKLGVIIATKNSLNKGTIYRTLVLDHQPCPSDESDKKYSDMFCKIVALTPRNRFFYPEGNAGHIVLDITSDDLVDITKHNMKVDGEIVLRNWEQRQIARFRDNPPGASVIKVVTELQKLNDNYAVNTESLKLLILTKELNISSEADIAQIYHVEKLEDELTKMLPHTNIVGFEEEFLKIFERRALERKIEDLKFKNSIKNNSLYPDYLNKLEVLRALNYIDESDEVTLKGKVACEMGQNELLITELILCNTFNALGPAEIAALLSGLVFQAKMRSSPVIPECLKSCVEDFEQINDRILQQEQEHHALNSTESRLNFGLIEVVYEWARNKPFAEIMKLTEVQEGIIVRCIQQLDETLRDVKTAAVRIGNPALQTKMDEASKVIKRDIVFTASLYTEL